MPPSLLLALALALPAASQEEEAPPEPAAAARDYRSFTSARRTFSCDVPARGWEAFEEETPLGSAAHFLGPAEESGRWRAALHVHLVEKEQPGFVPLDDAVKRSRRGDRWTARSAGAVRRWRVSKRSARRFEVAETRLAPADRLPAAPAEFHHFYAFVPAGDGYFVVKLSTSRETYLDYRALFERVLHSFRVLGYP